MRPNRAVVDNRSMIEAGTTCPQCASGSLIEHAVHDGMGWVQQLECEDCRHVLDSVSYLSQESVYFTELVASQPKGRFFRV